VRRGGMTMAVRTNSRIILNMSTTADTTVLILLRFLKLSSVFDREINLMEKLLRMCRSWKHTSHMAHHESLVASKEINLKITGNLVIETYFSYLPIGSIMTKIKTTPR
jgi:hypothetical protein